MTIYANQLLRAAIGAQEALLAEIRSAGSVHTVDGRIPRVSRVFELQRVATMKQQEKRSMTPAPPSPLRRATEPEPLPEPPAAVAQEAPPPSRKRAFDLAEL